MADDKLELGVSLEDGKMVDLTPKERLQGTYIIGTTGTGKSTLIRNMIFQDMHPSKREGLCLLDPHGDLIDEILGMIPTDRAEDVILFDPMDTECPIGLNLLHCDRKNATEVRWVVSTVVGILYRLYQYSWGPRLQYVLTSALETIMQFDGTISGALISC
jgi:DNA helicase HerA-like ATPase